MKVRKKVEKFVGNNRGEACMACPRCACGARAVFHKCAVLGSLKFSGWLPAPALRQGCLPPPIFCPLACLSTSKGYYDLLSTQTTINDL